MTTTTERCSWLTGVGRLAVVAIAEGEELPRAELRILELTIGRFGSVGVAAQAGDWIAKHPSAMLELIADRREELADDSPLCEVCGARGVELEARGETVADPLACRAGCKEPGPAELCELAEAGDLEARR